jgi:hypothetical protein
MKTLSNQWTVTEEKIHINLFKCKNEIETKKLTAVEISLGNEPFPLLTKEKISEIVGPHFEIKAFPNPQNQSMKVIISPKEYCLVDGAMMYSTVAHIMKRLTSNKIFFTQVKNIYNQEWVPSFPS